MKKILVFLCLFPINIFSFDSQMKQWYENFLDLRSNEQFDIDACLETKINIYKAKIEKNYKLLSMFESSASFQCDGQYLSDNAKKLIKEIDEKASMDSTNNWHLYIYTIFRSSIQKRIKEISDLRQYKLEKFLKRLKQFITI